jgi:hypothetical protein
MFGIPHVLVRHSYKSIYKTSGGSGLKKVMPQGQERRQEIVNPNRLRITGGTARGKKIDSPDVYLRPMMAKVSAYHNTITGTIIW